MTTAKKKTYRKILKSLLNRAQGRDQRDEEAAPNAICSMATIHPAEVGTENYLKELDFALVENEQHLLSEVRDALRRIDDGSFGRCEVCGTSIREARLRALPYARLCIGCAERSSHEGRINIGARRRSSPSFDLNPSESVSDRVAVAVARWDAS